MGVAEPTLDFVVHKGTSTEDDIKVKDIAMGGQFPSNISGISATSSFLN